MIDSSRRNFIRTFSRGTLYSSALAVTGISSLSNIAFADSTLDQTSATEIVTLINHTSSVLTIDNISGVAITELNDERVVILAEGEKSTFIVPAITNRTGSAYNKNLFITDVMRDGNVKIQSDYTEFNGIHPASILS